MKDQILNMTVAEAIDFLGAQQAIRLKTVSRLLNTCITHIKKHDQEVLENRVPVDGNDQ